MRRSRAQVEVDSVHERDLLVQGRLEHTCGHLPTTAWTHAFDTLKLPVKRVTLQPTKFNVLLDGTKIHATERAQLRQDVLSGEIDHKLSRQLQSYQRQHHQNLTPSQGSLVELVNVQDRPSLTGFCATILGAAGQGFWRVQVNGEEIIVPLECMRQAPVRVLVNRSSFAEAFEESVASICTLTPHQKNALNAIGLDSDNVHLSAPAGAGKTFVALNRVLEVLRSGRRVLFAARNKALALFAASWVARRALGGKFGRRAILRGLDLMYSDTCNDWRAYSLRIRSSKIESLIRTERKEYALVVVDEAHHLFGCAESRSAIEAHMNTCTRLLLLSDESQRADGRFGISYPPAVRVRLSEVIRCSKRIVAGAMAFQLGGEVKLLTQCNHESNGPPLQSFLFDSPKADNKERMLHYAAQTVRALQHMRQLFPSLALGGRLALLVPDDEFRSNFEPLIESHLRQFNLRIINAAEACAEVTAPNDYCHEFHDEEKEGDDHEFQDEEEENGDGESVFEGGSEHVRKEEGAGASASGEGIEPPLSSILLDTVSAMDGLERLIVIAIGLDTPIDSAHETTEGGRSLLYRALTRAQLAAAVVNEFVAGGFLEFLGHCRFDGQFEAEKVMENTAVTHIEDAVHADITEALTIEMAKSQPAAIVLSTVEMSHLISLVIKRRERGESLSKAAESTLIEWEGSRASIRQIVCESIVRNPFGISPKAEDFDEISRSACLSLAKGHSSSVGSAVREFLNSWMEKEENHLIDSNVEKFTDCPKVKMLINDVDVLKMKDIDVPDITHGDGSELNNLDASSEDAYLSTKGIDEDILSPVGVVEWLKGADKKIVREEVRKLFSKAASTVEETTHMSFEESAYTSVELATFHVMSRWLELFDIVKRVVSDVGTPVDRQIVYSIGKAAFLDNSLRNDSLLHFAMDKVKEHAEKLKRIRITHLIRVSSSSKALKPKFWDTNEEAFTDDAVVSVILNLFERALEFREQGFVRALKGVLIGDPQKVDERIAVSAAVDCFYEAEITASRQIECELGSHPQLAKVPKNTCRELMSEIWCDWSEYFFELTDDNKLELSSTSKQILLSAIKYAVQRKVIEWATQQAKVDEQYSQVASSLTMIGRARNVHLPDYAFEELLRRALRAVEDGALIQEACSHVLQEYERQRIRRLVRQTVWDTSTNVGVAPSQRSGMIQFMPFRDDEAGKLDFELLEHVFSFIPLREYGKLALVCKRWRSIINDPNWQPELLAFGWGSKVDLGLESFDLLHDDESIKYPIPLPLASQVAIAELVATDGATFAMTKYGSVWHWGRHWFPMMPNQLQPRKIEELKGVVSIRCTPPGYFHARAGSRGISCAAITHTGELFMWGSRLAVPDSSSASPVSLRTPTRIKGFGLEDHDDWKRKRKSGNSPLEDEEPRLARLLAIGLVHTAIATTAVNAPDELPTQVLTCGTLCFRFDESEWALQALPELDGVKIKALESGAFHCCVLTDRGHLYTWGHEYGLDLSNGNLLGHGRPISHTMAAEALPPRLVETDAGTIVEVACSTYSTMAITIDGRVFTWGDCDGGALGHSENACHEPTCVQALRGTRIAHGSLSYTNAAVASHDGLCYMWGGNAWLGGIANKSGTLEVDVEGSSTVVGPHDPMTLNAPYQVEGFSGVPPCYRCTSISLGQNHGYMIFKKRLDAACMAL